MSLLDSIGGFFAAGAKKKQTKNIIRDYGAAEAGAGVARDASLGYFQPYAEGGQNAFARAGDMLKPGYDYTSEDPSFEFGLKTGVNAIDRSAARAGAIGSGGTLKALARFGTDYGTTKFGESFDRQNQLAKYGFNAAQGQAGVQQNYSNALFNAADGRSGARMARADAIGEQWGAGISAVKDVAAFFL
ncbi:MAG TPA: hypothetical protein VLJ13_10285 [Brevundimonas sp.]|nr:hypothetical protein [Brevundimonas sp.]